MARRKKLKFDTKAVGEKLKKQRFAHGYTSCAKLSEAIEQKTGVSLSPQLLYKFEAGTQDMKLAQAAAIALTFEERQGEWEFYLSQLMKAGGLKARW